MHPTSSLASRQSYFPSQISLFHIHSFVEDRQRHWYGQQCGLSSSDVAVKMRPYQVFSDDAVVTLLTSHALECIKCMKVVWLEVL